VAKGAPAGMKATPVQTQTTIRSLLEEAGLRPTRRFGQHFLIDGNLMRKLVASADIRPTDTLLEVGTGTASLTQELAAVAGQVVTVEVDRGVAAVAGRMLEGLHNVLLLHCDVLRGKHEIDPQVLTAVERASTRLGGRAVLVANLPYQIASPLLIDLLVGSIRWSRMCFTVQQEVGDRLLAQPGGKDYGPLSVILQALADLSRIASVPPQAFWPRPQVESVMMQVDPSEARRRDLGDPAAFAAVVRSSFLHRRKTLSYNLTSTYGAEIAGRVLAEVGIAPQTRPERIAPQEWVVLARRLLEARP
jgi:16S rRNA (adenine1518-N6/adenine1519-N6)-dimethyltransferase